MATMIVRHSVADFDQWKNVYDGFAETRKEYGLTGASVHRDAQDPNTIVVVHEFDSVADAQSFADSEELKSAMGEAGVTGPPTIWFCEDVERTAY